MEERFTGEGRGARRPFFEKQTNPQYMPSTKDNEKFRDSLFIGKSLLDDAIEWIHDNMKPDQVFGDNELG